MEQLVGEIQMDSLSVALLTDTVHRQLMTRWSLTVVVAGRTHGYHRAVSYAH
jgi:hypothetical protein